MQTIRCHTWLVLLGGINITGTTRACIHHCCFKNPFNHERIFFDYLCDVDVPVLVLRWGISSPLFGWFIMLWSPDFLCFTMFKLSYICYVKHFMWLKISACPVARGSELPRLAYSSNMHSRLISYREHAWVFQMWSWILESMLYYKDKLQWWWVMLCRDW